MKPVEEIARDVINAGVPVVPEPSSYSARVALPRLETAIIVALRAERERAERAEAALERDRTLVAVALNKTKAAIAGRAWLLEGGRGPYSWDDDRFRAEFGYALEEIDQPLKDLAKIARDWTNCPTDPDAIAAARIDWKDRAQQAAVSALATARNRALEEAAEVAGEELTAYDEEGNDGEVWVVRKIVDAILALRAKEPDHE